MAAKPCEAVEGELHLAGGNFCLREGHYVYIVGRDQVCQVEISGAVQDAVAVPQENLEAKLFL
jgi:hypothetical protein